MSKENRYIITGGPGSGKSSLLNALIKANYQGFEEISRIVIREQHKLGGDKLPWKNLQAFAEVCYERMGKQLEKCEPDTLCFYDRGLPDIIAYMRRGALHIEEKYYEKCSEYNNTVFIAPPWKDIFINDAERPESFSDSLEIYQFLKETYLELGFEIIELPKVTIPERVKFIEAYITTCKD
ncbi:AAA family ATPase [Marinifilum sp. RC60d5]|uniref:AAA family ATPase n=1 Tax=Marinifilum sp. RC60d5 TaxID=3458414 RepID=UPI00403519C3